MAFDFPSNPVADQEFAPVPEKAYVWNGEAWRGKSAATNAPPSTEKWVEEAPIDGKIYGRQDAAWVTAQSPRPVVNSLDPPFCGKDDADLVLRVLGSGFEPQSIIYLNTTAVPTTFVSATELTTPIQPDETSNNGYSYTVSVRTDNIPSGIPYLEFYLYGNPRIIDVTPATATIAGGPVQITVTGGYFSNLADIRTVITADGVAIATDPMTVSNTLTAMLTPPAAAGTVQINVQGGDPMTLQPSPDDPAQPFVWT